MRLWLPLLVLFLLLLPEFARAQGKLSGVVQDSVTHEPLAFASVFLANTTLGVTTTEQGTFEFPKVPAGTYDVVGSYVGYGLGKQSITMGRDAQKVTLLLAPKTSQLAEVVVRPNPHRASDYQKFTELFLGGTTFSRQCRISNPDDVLVDFDPETNELTASAYRFVQVDNQALGYRIKYYGLRFNTDFNRHVITFYGQPVFEEMTPRNARQQRRWEANRAAAYRGSLTHFLRSVHDGTVEAEGFMVQRLRIVPNPRFARADSLRRQLLQDRLGVGLTKPEQDSVGHWARVAPAFSMLYTKPRPLDSLRRQEAAGRVFLRFRDNLQVSYLRESPDPNYQVRTALPTNAPYPPAGRQVSQLVLLLPEIEIQPNGQLTNPLAVFTDEYWGFEKMGEFLPVNYQPPTPAASPKSAHP